MRRASLLVLLIGSALLLAQPSCLSIAVEGQSPTPSQGVVASVAVASPLPVNHDVAITAIDFEPPLTSGKTILTKPISLMVVVENRGNQRESNIPVEAAIYSPNSFEPLFQRAIVVDKLVPGESQVVRFENIVSLPLRSAYTLTVQAGPVPSEEALDNNSKTYQFQVNSQ